MIPDLGQSEEVFRIPRGGLGWDHAEQWLNSHRHLHHQLAVRLVGLCVDHGMARDLAARPGVIAAAEKMITIRQRRECAVEGDDFEIVIRQLKLADHLWTEQADHVRAHRVLKTGVNLLGYCGTANQMAALQNKDSLAGFRQVCGAGEAVVAGADDDRVVICHGCDLLKSAYLVISSAKSTRQWSICESKKAKPVLT